MDGSGGGGRRWRTEATTAERVRYELPRQAFWGREGPGLGHQFGKIDPTPACAPAVCRGDNTNALVEQYLGRQILLRERIGNSSEHQFDTALPKLAEIWRRGGDLHHAKHESRMA